MTDLISTDIPFTPDQRQQLAWLADQMIPATDKLPSGGSPAVHADTLVYLAGDEVLVKTALLTLDDRLSALGQSGLENPDQQVCQDLVNTLKESEGAFIQAFQGAVLASYYRHDRVLDSLGLPARAPFPEGNRVNATDWSLLDPVRQRTPFFREAN